MEMTEREGKLIDDLWEKAESKGYREQTVEMALMFACTVEMVNKYGSEENALEEIVKLCEKNDSGEKFIAEVGALIGV